MENLEERAPQRNKKASKQQIAPAWSGEHRLNQREAVRIEISDYRGQLIFDLRRCFYPDGEPPRPTKKGLACAVKHLPALAALLNEALHHARVKGLLPTEGGADTLLRDGGCS
jgi:hypothetical protein